MKLHTFIIKASKAVPFLYDVFLAYFYRKAMKSCGKGVYIRPSCSDIKGLENLSVGEYTSIPIQKKLMLMRPIPLKRPIL